MAAIKINATNIVRIILPKKPATSLVLFETLTKIPSPFLGVYKPFTFYYIIFLLSSSKHYFLTNISLNLLLFQYYTIFSHYFFVFL